MMLDPLMLDPEDLEDEEEGMLEFLVRCVCCLFDQCCAVYVGRWYEALTPIANSDAPPHMHPRRRGPRRGARPRRRRRRRRRPSPRCTRRRRGRGLTTRRGRSWCWMWSSRWS